MHFASRMIQNKSLNWGGERCHVTVAMPSLSIITPFIKFYKMGSVAGVDQSNPFIITIEGRYLNLNLLAPPRETRLLLKSIRA